MCEASARNAYVTVTKLATEFWRGTNQVLGNVAQLLAPASMYGECCTGKTMLIRVKSNYMT